MHFINTIIPYIETLGLASYFIIFLISLAESLAFVGLLIPGTTLLIVIGFFLANGALDATAVFLVSIIGAVIGDAISFFLGRREVGNFNNGGKLFKLSHLERGENFVKKHGNKSVFLGRFIGPLRPIVPFIAGMFKMSPNRFFFWNILSAFGWAGFYLTLGYFFGQSWIAISTWASELKTFILLIALTLLFLYLLKWLLQVIGLSVIISLQLLWRKLKIKIKERPRWQNWLIRHSQLINFFYKRLERQNFFGLPFTLLMLMFGYILILWIKIALAVAGSESIIQTDRQVEKLMPIFRNDILINVFHGITLFGSFQVITILSLALIAILWAVHKKEYIFPFLVAMLGNGLFVFWEKIFFSRPRPHGAVYLLKSFSFPSGHSAFAVAFYGFLAYILWRQVTTWTNKINVLFAGLTIIIFIGFSRLYLDVHFLSDVWAGYLTGSLWLIIGIGVLEFFQRKNN